MIRKNPANDTLRDYGEEPNAKRALTQAQQESLIAFMERSNIYQVYLPMVRILLGTACRVGEFLGLTWADVDMKNREINIDHQLLYKNFGDGTKFHITKLKTEAGNRTIPMSRSVRKAFEQQREYQFMLGIDRDVTIEGYKKFIFTSRNGRPLQLSAVNNVLYNIVTAYNREEKERAARERRKPTLMPSISAHTLRHTGCTRMAEKGMDIKVLQYIMGHSNIAVTMEVYNHITEKQRIENEIKKMDDLMAV